MVWMLVLGVVVVAFGLGGLWLLAKRSADNHRKRQSWQTPPARPPAPTAPPTTAAQRAAARSAARSLPRPPANQEEDNGPATVLSYLHFDHSDLSEDSLPPSSLPTQVSDTPEGQRIDLALKQLRDGAASQAWDTLKGFSPPREHQAACMEVLERLALAFERERLYEQARAVYEQMADIDPYWRDIKLRLMRARGLAQNAKANTWGTVPSQPLPEVPSKQLGKYVIDKQIGRGAMGAVYLGYDPATGRRLALKTMALAKEFSGADLIDARSRFLREAEMAGRLDHPDIVRVTDAGELGGLAFIAMELVEGRELSDYAEPGKLLPWQDLVRIMIRVAEALAYAHSRGVTHRDIKPANIMFDKASDAVKLMDFGVARVADAARTRTGVVLGTPSFMSPEQLAGQTIDGRSDLYSLGVTMFQLLTGRLPHAHDSMAALMRAVAHEPAPHVCDICPDLPRNVGDVVDLALQKHTNTRYANGLQMAEDLRAVLSMAPPARRARGVDMETR
jgi:serine/threonine-protein kinase